MKNKLFGIFRSVGPLGAACLLSIGATGTSFAAASSSVDAVTLRLDVDRPVLLAGTTETVILKVALAGRRPAQADRAPVNLALVIDRSGSMSGEKIERAREAALEAVRRLAADDVVTLITYNNHAEVVVPARRVGDGRALEDAIRRIQPGGGTNLYGGLEAGAAEVRRRIEESYAHRVILLSDGLANVGPSSPQELGRFGGELVRQGISVSTIGVGLDFNEDLMTRLARRSDGNTYFVQHSRDLPRIFQQELGDVLSVVARRAVVEITFPNGVRPVRIVGREGRVDDDRVTVELNQLYGGQEKFALVEVEVASGEAGRKRDLARASLTYEFINGDVSRPVSEHAVVGYARDEAAVVASANHEVQMDYAANRMAETKDQVVELVDAGRRKEASSLLSSVGAALGSLGDRFGNSDMARYAPTAAAEAERIDRDGIDNRMRKVYRAESAQTINQQQSDSSR